MKVVMSLFSFLLSLTLIGVNPVEAEEDQPLEEMDRATNEEKLVNELIEMTDTLNFLNDDDLDTNYEESPSLVEEKEMDRLASKTTVSNEVLKNGDSGDRVLKLKNDLAKLGFVVSDNPNQDFGPKTTEVVKDFQKYYGLKVTGIADESTFAKIEEVLSSPFRIGQSSPAIKELKLKLVKIGYVVSDNPNNDYGPKTASVIEDFQRKNGLRVNGIADEVTLAKIDELFNSKYMITEVKYNITLEEALFMQMNVRGTPPQTDKYRNDPAYVSGRYIEVLEGGYINGTSVRIRTSPKLNTNNNIFDTVGYGVHFAVLDDNVKGDEFAGSTKWYKILYNKKEVYVHSSLAKIDNTKIGRVTSELNVRSKSNTSGHIFGKVYKNDTLQIVNQLSNGWYQVKFGTWRNATEADTRYYLDPTKFINDDVQMFQFLDLSKSSGVTPDALNRYLKGKGVLEGMGEAFIEAGKKHGINELYLVAHALLETGNGKSSLAKGIKVNGVTVHNVYGIGAYDHDPDNLGAKKAYEEGWTSVEKAIIGGAAFIGNDYIKAGQNTLYKMRWNPDGMIKYGEATHQYATDIAWASKQLHNLYNLYQEVGSYKLYLEYPIYKS